MKSKELKIYNIMMFAIWFIIIVLLIIRAFNHKGVYQTLPKQKEIVESVYIDPQDLNKIDLSLKQRNYYDAIYDAN